MKRMGEVRRLVQVERARRALGCYARMGGRLRTEGGQVEAGVAAFCLAEGKMLVVLFPDVEASLIVAER